MLTEPTREDGVKQDEPNTLASPSNPRSMALWLLPLAAIGLAGYFAMLQLSQWPARLQYPGEADFIEGTPLAEMLHLRQGIRIYAPLLSARRDVG